MHPGEEQKLISCAFGSIFGRRMLKFEFGKKVENTWSGDLQEWRIKFEHERYLALGNTSSSDGSALEKGVFDLAKVGNMRQQEEHDLIEKDELPFAL